MKKNLILILSALFATIAVSCSNHATESTAVETTETNMTEAATEEVEPQKEESTGEEKVMYTCPMHPEVISETEGTCPKCGMNLVIKE